MKISKADIMTFLADFQYKRYSKEGKYMGMFGLSEEEIAKLADDLYSKFIIQRNEKQRKS